MPSFETLDIHFPPLPSKSHTIARVLRGTHFTFCNSPCLYHTESAPVLSSHSPEIGGDDRTCHHTYHSPCHCTCRTSQNGPGHSGQTRSESSLEALLEGKGTESIKGLRRCPSQGSCQTVTRILQNSAHQQPCSKKDKKPIGKRILRVASATSLAKTVLDRFAGLTKIIPRSAWCLKKKARH
jgi:hypothetical protein